MPIANIGAILSSGIQIGGNATETAVARAYLIRHVDDFDRVEFSVGMGPGITLPAGTPAYVQTSATASTKPRADMVLFRGDYATIVEVKDRLYSAVMGQLLTYWHMFTVDSPQYRQVYKVAAGISIQDGLQPILDQYGIQVELYPFAVQASAPNS